MSECRPVSLHVERSGTGRPVVLAHGFGGSARNFRPQARALEDRYQLVLYDARGHGRSEAPADPSQYEPDCVTEDLARVVAETGSDRVCVGGLSMGAGVALRFALAHPERVSALVLAAFPRGAREDGSADWALSLADAIEREGLETAGSRYIWGERSRFDPRGAALIRQGFLEHRPEALAATLRHLLAVQPAVEDMRARLARLDVPVLVIVGSNDPGSVAPSHALSEALPHAHLTVIEGAGHVVNLVAQAAFNAALDAFLRAT